MLSSSLQAVLDEVIHRNITDKQWIATETWVTLATISIPKNLPVLRGTIGFALPRAKIPGLGPFLTRLRPRGPSLHHDPFLREFWETMFNCYLDLRPNTGAVSKKQCSGLEVIGEQNL